MMHVPTDKRAGFSLMETMIGLMLTAMIAVAVTQSVSTGLRLWRAAQANDANFERSRTDRLVESWMGGALPPLAFQVDPQLIFDGREDRVSFVVDGQVGRKTAGYSRIDLVTRPSLTCEGREDLVLVWHDVAASADFSSLASDERVLQPCVLSVEFNYRGRKAVNAPGAASEFSEWRNEMGLPASITISIDDGRNVTRLAARTRFAGE